MQLTGLQVFSAVASSGVQTEGLIQALSMSQTARRLILPNINLYYFSKDQPMLIIGCLPLLWFILL